MKYFSFALVISPLIFSGCMQKRVNNIVPPLNEQNATDQSQFDTNKSDGLIETIETNLTTQQSHALTTSTYHTESDLIIANNYGYVEISEDNYGIEELPAEAIIDNTTYNGLVELVQGQSLQDDTGMEPTQTQAWEEENKQEEIIETAMTYLDTKYVWAANGPSAFDCSGFTKYVYKKNGMTLPRYSGHQAKVGTQVSFDELKKGDLVFFDTDKKYTKRVNHVGIYMGKGKFIHASSAKKKVVITSFDKKRFYKKRFLWGQRVMTDDVRYSSL